MSDLARTVEGGFTRVCGDCGYKWATSTHPISDEHPEPCPECGHRNGEGEDTFDWSTCPGCGKTGLTKRASVTGFPGQRWCSAKCAGL